MNIVREVRSGRLRLQCASGQSRRAPIGGAPEQHVEHALQVLPDGLRGSRAAHHYVRQLNQGIVWNGLDQQVRACCVERQHRPKFVFDRSQQGARRFAAGRDAVDALHERETADKLRQRRQRSLCGIALNAFAPHMRIGRAEAGCAVELRQRAGEVGNRAHVPVQERLDRHPRQL